jgi:UDP-N-acetyl-D-mannosaminuronate dehydrogenase
VDGTGRSTSEAGVLVLGQTFKSDVADFRNSKAVGLADNLAEKFKTVTTFDPFGGDGPGNENPIGSSKKYDAVVVAVGHSEFFEVRSAVVDLVAPGGVLIDLTGKIDSSDVANSSLQLWKF